MVHPRRLGGGDGPCVTKLVGPDEKRPAQSLKPPWGRAGRLQRCSGSAATEQDLCTTVIATSKVNWVTTLESVIKVDVLGPWYKPVNSGLKLVNWCTGRRCVRGAPDHDGLGKKKKGVHGVRDLKPQTPDS